jgi:hypothetical protein
MILTIMAKHRLNLFDLPSVAAAFDTRRRRRRRPRTAQPVRTAIVRGDLLPGVVRAELSNGAIAYRRANGDWRYDETEGLYLPVGKKWRHICESAYRKALKDGTCMDGPAPG